MRNQLSLSIILTLIFVLFSSCTKKVDTDEKVLHFVVSAKIKGMDPVDASDAYSSAEMARIYEGLLEYNYLKRPYTLTANLAESMPVVSSDGLTYTFKIKKGVLFQNDKAFPSGKGRELVAKDFVYSLMRLADPKLNSTGWWLLDGKLVGLNAWREKNANAQNVNYDEEIEGLKALDNSTLQFKLTKPFPQFLYALAMPFTYVVAKEVVDFYGKDFLNHPVGTGPFVLPVFTQTNQIVYTKNPTFREKLYPSEGEEGDKEKGYLDDAGKRLPLVDKVVVDIIIESQPAWLSFQKGKIDLLAIPKDNFQSAITPNKELAPEMKNKGIKLQITPSLDVTYTAFNHANPLFKNLKLRQAMSLAMDSERANELFNSNQAIIAQSVIPPGIAGYDKNYKNPYVGRNIEKAKQLLSEAGYPEGKGLPEITYDTAASTQSRQMGEFFAKNMSDIGIKIKVFENPWPELQNKIANKTTMTFGIAWSADYPDAENFLQLLYSKNAAPGSNGANYNNPAFDELFLKSSLMQDSPERTALYEKLNKMVAEDLPWLFGVHRTTFELAQGWVKNYKYTEFSLGQSAYLNIDSKIKEELLKKF